MPEAEKPWTTPERAAGAVDAARKALVTRLRQHAEDVAASAEALHTPEVAVKDWVTPGVFGLAPVEELRIAMLAISSTSADREVADVKEVHGAYPLPTGREEGLESDADRLLKALAAYTRIGGQNGEASAVGIEDARRLRGLLGRHLDGTVHVGDCVQWKDGKEEFRGKVINIHDGTCVVAHVSRLVAHGSSSVRGVRLVPVGEVEPEPVDYY